MTLRPPRLFVYGTLMPGQARWAALAADVLAVEPATAKGALWDTGAGYPAARFGAAGGEIPGFLVSIAPDRLLTVIAALDRIEREGLLFRRVEVATSGGSALSYEWMGSTEGFLPLPDGWHGSDASQLRGHGRAWSAGAWTSRKPGSS